ncbi:hypothetical protein ACFW35_14530 [Fictibacillus sp. NPDC058756]|uniref:hypothetical protein n=1 Tax=Fictibacillus sp. NPDC058756 TaxID=3346625 RepID=UPI00367F438A
MNNHLKKNKTFLSLIIIILLAGISSPFWVWRTLPKKIVSITIIDKTVDDENYREHTGLVWALNHLKVQKQHAVRYEDAADFYKEIPDFQKENLPKIIYLADTYGVETVKENNRVVVEGGIATEEVNRLRNAVLTGKTNLIAEFNTFASPTEREAREELSNLLHLKWSGWIGRYFSDLNSKEVPVWVKRNYKEQYGDWKHQGAGMLFVHENGEMIIIEEKDMREKGAMFRFTKQGETVYHLKASVPYPYWFDIIKPLNKQEVMANYELKLTQSGKEKLMKQDIPFTFPAIIHHQNETYHSLYFAGDYADQSELPGIYQTWGFSWIRQHVVLDDGNGNTFYWKVYLPLMKTLLTRFS